MEYAALLPIVHLLPGYAHKRRDRWVPTGLIPESLTLSDYVVLRRVAIERDDEPIPYALNPYCTVDRFLEPLPNLVARGFLDQSGDEYSLTRIGTDLLMRGECAANDFAAERVRPALAPNDLARLALTLTDVTDRQRQAPEPVDKSHQDRVPRLQRFDTRQDPAIQLEYAIYALQRARDDAHISAWRAAGFNGSALALLSHIWAGDVSTSTELLDLTQGRMRPQDVEALIAGLRADGYIAFDRPIVTITEHGRAARDAIEHETNRVYFAPWPAIDAEWVRGQLEILVTALAS
jgi:hypothetical protein